jgi:branched-chain amino acid transport system permease protein
MLTILLDGIAYGMLLFLIASGLAVTLGLMNFVNLAHGAFAMAGGYVAAVLSNRLGVPFLATLPLAFAPRALGALLEPTLYRRCTAGRTSTRCCSRSGSCSWRWRRSITRSARRSST